MDHIRAMRSTEQGVFLLLLLSGHAHDLVIRHHAVTEHREIVVEDQYRETVAADQSETVVEDQYTVVVMADLRVTAVEGQTVKVVDHRPRS